MDLSSIFIAVSLAQGLPPHMLESICWQESKGHPEQCYSDDCRTGRSVGPCQVKKRTCESVGVVGNIHAARLNVECAGRYVRAQYDRYHSWRRAICAYNRGKSTGDGDNTYTRAVIKEWRRRVMEGRTR